MQDKEGGFKTATPAGYHRFIMDAICYTDIPSFIVQLVCYRYLPNTYPQWLCQNFSLRTSACNEILFGIKKWLQE